jgi:hypothetical protein
MQKAGFAQKYPIKTPFLCKTPVFCAESLIFVQNQVLHKNDFFPIKSLDLKTWLIKPRAETFILCKTPAQPQFVNRANDATKVMTENFAKQFVNLRFLGFAFQTFAKLSFYHRKSCFDV